MLVDNQSSPSYRPSPEVAQQLCTNLRGEGRWGEEEVVGVAARRASCA